MKKSERQPTFRFKKNKKKLILRNVKKRFVNKEIKKIIGTLANVPIKKKIKKIFRSVKKRFVNNFNEKSER